MKKTLSILAMACTLFFSTAQAEVYHLLTDSQADGTATVCMGVGDTVAKPTLVVFKENGAVSLHTRISKNHERVVWVVYDLQDTMKGVRKYSFNGTDYEITELGHHWYQYSFVKEIK